MKISVLILACRWSGYNEAYPVKCRDVVEAIVLSKVKALTPNLYES